MKDKPRDIHTPLLNKSVTTQVVLEGVLIAISTIIAFRIGLQAGDTLTASTMAFATLCLARLVHGFNSRSNQSIFTIGVFSNMYTWLAFVIGVLSLHAVLFVPSLTGMFEVAVLNGRQLGFIYCLSFMPFLVNQWYKVLFVRGDEGEKGYPVEGYPFSNCSNLSYKIINSFGDFVIISMPSFS